MNITIELPEGITEKQATEITNYANGLVTFYLDETRQVAEKEEASLDIERLAALKADEVKLAAVDQAIAMKVAIVDAKVGIVEVVR